jgi:hypothetical protein
VDFQVRPTHADLAPSRALRRAAFQTLPMVARDRFLACNDVEDLTDEWDAIARLLLVQGFL